MICNGLPIPEKPPSGRFFSQMRHHYGILFIITYEQKKHNERETLHKNDNGKKKKKTQYELAQFWVEFGANSMGHFHVVIINDLLTPPSDQPSLDDLANVLSFSLADTMDEVVHDEARHFFMECHQISNESQFLVDSLPFETAVVERACRQLNAIRVILLALNDPHSSAQQMADLIANLDSLLYPLDDFLSNPPLPPHTHIPLNPTGKSVRIHGATWPDFSRLHQRA
ncbi:hypothetical protein B0H13DRAFT_1851357 [Mycena leptocephala]|nr:hypothetical protein B0H13DRAFT_1851357 [Mycena leptocephala]